MCCVELLESCRVWVSAALETETRRSMDKQAEPSSAFSRDVFISYADADRTIAETVCRALEGESIACWIAPRDVPPGTSFPTAILDGINQSKVMVLVFSSNANLSNHVFREVERAVSKGSSVLTFRIENTRPTENLEYLISSTQWLDAWTPPLEPQLLRMARAVRELLSGDDRAANHSAILRFRWFINSLTLVPDEIMKKISTLRRVYALGGYDQTPCENPEVIEKDMDALDQLCGAEGVVLPDSWRELYWQTGTIAAITGADRERILRFLNTADDELLSWAQALSSWVHNFQRSLFVKRFFIGKQDDAEQMLRRLEDAGLISQGFPSGGRLERDTGTWRHKRTHLSEMIQQYWDASGVSVPPLGRLSR
jgi:hypothetical protein